MRNTTFYNQNITKKQVLSFILLVFAFVLPTQIQAQDPAVAWANKFTASFYGADNSSMATDSSGNVYMTGQFTGTVEFGNITLTSTSVGQSDAFVVKVNASGTVLWAEKFGGSVQDFGKGITVDDSGNVYTTGLFKDTATFGTITLTGEPTAQEIFVVKQNSSGQVLWAEKFYGSAIGGTPQFQTTGIAVDSQGNLYTTGYFSDGYGGGTATFGDFTLSFISETTTSNAGTDIFVVKQNASGQVLWAKNFGANNSGNAGIIGRHIATDASDNIYITGQFIGTADFEGTILTYLSGTGTAFVTKMDTFGNVLWAEHFGEEGTGFSSRGSGITVDTTGNVYITGVFGGEMTIGDDTITSVGIYNNMFLLKTDSSGAGLWAKGFGNDVTGKDVATDDLGNVYVTGYFSNTANFDDITLTSIGLSNTFILRTDNSGTVEWAEQFSSTGGDNYGYHITLGLEENIYVSGHFSGTTTFGDTSLTATGTNNIFLVKIAMDGNLIVEQSQHEQYKVYPNPVKDIIHIEIPEHSTETAVEVYNLLGQKVMDFGNITDSKSLDLSELTTGVYLLKINNHTIKIKKQ